MTTILRACIVIERDLGEIRDSVALYCKSLSGAVWNLRYLYASQSNICINVSQYWLYDN